MQAGSARSLSHYKWFSAFNSECIFEKLVKLVGYNIKRLYFVLVEVFFTPFHSSTVVTMMKEYLRYDLLMMCRLPAYETTTIQGWHAVQSARCWLWVCGLLAYFSAHHPTPRYKSERHRVTALSWRWRTYIKNRGIRPPCRLQNYLKRSSDRRSLDQHTE